MGVSSLHAQLARILSDAAISDSRLEAEVIVRHALGMARADYFAALSDAVPPAARRRALDMARRRAAGEPLAYIVGSREFYGLPLDVDPRVLIPRQETETLVDCVIERCAAYAPGAVTVADVGTGSGAIAIAVAARVPHARLLAIDSDAGALAVADANRRRHGVAARVRLLRGDLLAPLDAPVDVIASNPPYVRSADLPHLPPDVRREPVVALDGGPDGLAVIRRLLADAPARLNPGGALFVEIAPEQADEVATLARRSFPGAGVVVRPDALGLARVVCVA